MSSLEEINILSSAAFFFSVGYSRISNMDGRFVGSFYRH